MTFFNPKHESWIYKLYKQKTMKKIFYQNTVFNDGKDKVVTSIIFDNTKQTVSIVLEEGIKVIHFVLSMEKAMEIGFININALNKL